jgi:L-threonylcarbamoyladenylate synthase
MAPIQINGFSRWGIAATAHQAAKPRCEFPGCFMIQKDDEKTRVEASRIIADGGVIAFRTDTFYGLGADPLNSNAVQKIRELKGREDTKPILLLISDEAQVDRFIAQSDFFKIVAKGHWPAPLTLIGAARSDVPIELTAGTQSLGIRLPDDDNVRALVRVCGGALTATSANVSGHPPARTAREVANYFPTGIDLIIDGGEVTASDPSTVVDVSGPNPRLIREGAIRRDRLSDLL